jgi:hypothetical protein
MVVFPAVEAPGQTNRSRFDDGMQPGSHAADPSLAMPATGG